jgi:Tse2-like ADP-ribosyltransferase toxin
MAITVLKDVMIEANALDRYFEGKVPVDLWRAYNLARGEAPFDFVQVPFVLSNGRARAADIAIREENGLRWVYVRDRPRGVSLFDKEGLPPGKDWRYLKIPQGTALPEGLTIIRDELNTRWGATHYTLAPACDMPLSRFLELLARLAHQLVQQTPAEGTAP